MAAIYYAEKCMDHKYCGTHKLNKNLNCEQTQQKWQRMQLMIKISKCEFAFDEKDFIDGK